MSLFEMFKNIYDNPLFHRYLMHGIQGKHFFVYQTRERVEWKVQSYFIFIFCTWFMVFLTSYQNDEVDTTLSEFIKINRKKALYLLNQCWPNIIRFEIGSYFTWSGTNVISRDTSRTPQMQLPNLVNVNMEWIHLFTKHKD